MKKLVIILIVGLGFVYSFSSQGQELNSIKEETKKWCNEKNLNPVCRSWAYNYLLPGQNTADFHGQCACVYVL